MSSNPGFHADDGLEPVGEANRRFMIRLMTETLSQEDLDAIFVGIAPHVSAEAFEQAHTTWEPNPPQPDERSTG